VVDRRNDGGTYAPGANRAEVQARLEKQQLENKLLESTALPAQTGTESRPEGRAEGFKVACITDTPGPDALRRILLERVWGVMHQ